MAAVSTVNTNTGKISIDSLLKGKAWNGSITYGFPSNDVLYGAAYGAREQQSDFEPVTERMIQAFRSFIEGADGGSDMPKMLLTPLEGFTNIDLREVGSRLTSADVNIASSSIPATAYAYYPSGASSAGDVWFGQKYNFDKASVGTYAFATAMHEFGHALGLKHPHEGSKRLPAEQDFTEYTIMSYRSYMGHDKDRFTNEKVGYAQTYMINDVSALQTLYGANFSFRSNNTVYRWNPSTGEAYVNDIGQGRPGSGEVTGQKANRIFETIWDGGGQDTYDLSNYKSGVIIDLNPGGYSLFANKQRADLGDGHKARGNVYNAFQYKGSARSLIENAIGGAGHDDLKGNKAANSLVGNNGDDTLSGGAGKDVLTGGSGRDTFAFDVRPSNKNADRINDFSSRDDTIRLDGDIFTKLGTKEGTLAKSAFWMGKAAHTPDDRIIYHKASGTLAYDPDGTGPAAQAVFATLKLKKAISYRDFSIA